MRTARAKIASGGRFVIPAEYRKASGLHEGDIVTMQLEDGEIHLHTFAEGLRPAQASSASSFPKVCHW